MSAARRFAFGAMPSDEVGMADAEALARQEREREQRSGKLAAKYVERLRGATTLVVMEEIGKGLTPAVKRGWLAKDLECVRRAYTERLAVLKHKTTSTPGSNGRAGTTVETA